MNPQPYPKFLATALVATILLAASATAQSLGGNNNYVLTNNCSTVNGLTVSLHVTQDMIATVTPGGGGLGTPNGGFGLQLNANPPSSAPVTWMQFGFIVESNQASAFIQYWNSSGVNNHGQPVVRSLSSNTIPAGWVLAIQLSNDSSGNITAATFSVTDNDGNVSSVAMPMPTYPGTSTPVLSPIQSFQTDIVGPFNWENSTFSSGAGYLTYQVSSGQLSAQTSSCPSGNGTGEISNTTYWLFSPISGSSINESFTTPVYARSTTAFSAFHVESPLASSPMTCLSESNGAVINNCSYNVSLEFNLPIDSKGSKSILVQDYWTGTGQENTFACQSYAYTGTTGSSIPGSTIYFNAPYQNYNSIVYPSASGDSIQLICWNVPPGGGVANLNWTP